MRWDVIQGRRVNRNLNIDYKFISRKKLNILFESHFWFWKHQIKVEEKLAFEYFWNGNLFIWKFRTKIIFNFFCLGWLRFLSKSMFVLISSDEPKMSFVSLKF